MQYIKNRPPALFFPAQICLTSADFFLNEANFHHQNHALLFFTLLPFQPSSLPIFLIHLLFLKKRDPFNSKQTERKRHALVSCLSLFSPVQTHSFLLPGSFSPAAHSQFSPLIDDPLYLKSRSFKYISTPTSWNH